MEAVRENGLLWGAYENHKMIGLIGAMPEPLYGHQGLCFYELAVDDDYRGLGLAPAMQWRFIKQVAEDQTWIWGTIDSLNIPSLRSAKRIGRKPIQREYFLPLIETT